MGVRPGVTGWAQINGGNLVTNDEKGALDKWYVRHASVWLDLRIVALTLRFLITGERRSESALKEALREQKNGHSWKKLPFTRKAVREELGPAFRERFGLRAKSIKVWTQPDPHPDQLDRNKDL